MSRRITILLALFLLAGIAEAQERNFSVALNRGRLWHSFYLAQQSDPLSDWRRLNFGMDWPGFDVAELRQSIGGSNTYMLAGGMYLTALTDSGTVYGWADFARNVNSNDMVAWEGDNFRYLMRRHEHRWPDGENHWLRLDPNEAEEVIDSEWEINGAWFQPVDNLAMPFSVKRTVRQWSGSRADEDYLIIEYTIGNVQRREPLRGVYLMFSYALAPNQRGWNLNFPNLTDGARNTIGSWDPDRQLLTAYAGDYRSTPAFDESFDPFTFVKYDPINDRNLQQPEFVAPGFMGIKFLSIAPDSNGVADKINGFAWSAGSPSQDTGPFESVLGLNDKYDAMADPSLLTRAFVRDDDERMGDNRLYANVSLGPFTIERRDSIKIVLAQFVGGMSYEEARDPETTAADVAAAGDSAVQYLDERVRFNFEHDYRVPMPPPAPAFSVVPFDEPGTIGNTLSFGTESESVADPHQGTVDIAGYRIYRSGQLPFGPWELLADIPVGDPTYFSADSQKYIYADTKVAIGFGYYYSVTAYDSGHDAWAVDPSVSVPPLESSIFANRSREAFTTTLLPTRERVDRVTVVPNPFYRSSGFDEPGREKDIQFAFVPQVCTIRIYTLRGDLVKTIRHDDPGSGIAIWNQISDFGQYVKSGMYFFVLENDRGDVFRGKFSIVN